MLCMRICLIICITMDLDIARTAMIKKCPQLGLGTVLRLHRRALTGRHRRSDPRHRVDRSCRNPATHVTSFRPLSLKPSRWLPYPVGRVHNRQTKFFLHRS